MPVFANVAVLVVTSLHVLIGGVEMLLWKQPGVYTRLESLALTQGEANKVAPVVANAGLYNLFVAAGLARSVIANDPRGALFFLGFVAVAGIYGALTLKKTTLILQTGPAALASVAVWAAMFPNPFGG
jgi:putative membrane protein